MCVHDDDGDMCLFPNPHHPLSHTHIHVEDGLSFVCFDVFPINDVVVLFHVLFSVHPHFMTIPLLLCDVNERVWMMMNVMNGCSSTFIMMKNERCDMM